MQQLPGDDNKKRNVCIAFDKLIAGTAACNVMEFSKHRHNAETFCDQRPYKTITVIHRFE